MGPCLGRGLSHRASIIGCVYEPVDISFIPCYLKLVGSALWYFLVLFRLFSGTLFPSLSVLYELVDSALLNVGSPLQIFLSFLGLCVFSDPSSHIDHIQMGGWLRDFKDPSEIYRVGTMNSGASWRVISDAVHRKLLGQRLVVSSKTLLES